MARRAPCGLDAAGQAAVGAGRFRAARRWRQRLGGEAVAVKLDLFTEGVEVPLVALELEDDMSWGERSGGALLG